MPSLKDYPTHVQDQVHRKLKGDAAPTIPAQRARMMHATPSRHMNSLERKFAFRLDLLKAKGKIHDWRFEPLKLRLADLTYYTPDFLVIATDLTFEFYETKGFWEDDARVKIKVAAETFPWAPFVGVTVSRKPGAGFQYEPFPPYAGHICQLQQEAEP